MDTIKFAIIKLTLAIDKRLVISGYSTAPHEI